jgi:hypothetical protein
MNFSLRQRFFNAKGLGGLLDKYYLPQSPLSGGIIANAPRLVGLD